MTKSSFAKKMLCVLGAICLFVASMSLFSGTEYGVQICIGGYALGAVLFILSAVLGMNKGVSFSVPKRGLHVLGVIAVSIVLHSIGVWLMTHIHWVIGFAVILLGFANLLCLTPAAKGFADGN